MPAQVMHPEDARKYMDENTIGLVVMFGSTYNGQFEDVVLADKIVGGSSSPILEATRESDIESCDCVT